MVYAILQFFAHEGLPDAMFGVALPMSHLANAMANELPVCEETQEGLRKLLEARECFMRAAMLQMANQSEAEQNG